MSHKRHVYIWDDGAAKGAVKSEWPAANHQRCWVHKTANILAKLPKKLLAPTKSYIHQIWHADTRKNALKAYDEMSGKRQR